MGTGTFFSKVASNPLFQSLDLPGSHKYTNSIPVQVGPNQGPYTGVAPSLAGANAQYRAGGPGSNPGVGNTPSFYGPAGEGHGNAPGFWGTTNSVFSPFNSASMGIPTKIGNAASGNSGPGNGNPTPAPVNPYVQAARGAQQQGNQYGY